MSDKEKAKKNARTLTGKVISNKMESTVVVLVERKIKHPVYGKYIRRSKKIHAHDAGKNCKMGDVVVIESCRPISKTKSWRVVEHVQ